MERVKVGVSVTDTVLLSSSVTDKEAVAVDERNIVGEKVGVVVGERVRDWLAEAVLLGSSVRLSVVVTVADSVRVPETVTVADGLVHVIDKLLEIVAVLVSVADSCCVAEGVGVSVSVAVTVPLGVTVSEGVTVVVNDPVDVAETNGVREIEPVPLVVIVEEVEVVGERVFVTVEVRASVIVSV